MYSLYLDKVEKIFLNIDVDDTKFSMITLVKSWKLLDLLVKTYIMLKDKLLF